MIMLGKIKLLWLLLMVNRETASIVAQQSLRLEEKGDSCQVINFNCGGSSQDHSDGGEMPRNPGVPGKMGPVGPVGPKGSKGQTGSRGVKGETGENADMDEIKTDILGMLSASSCHELELRYGVAEAGYYLMREDGKPVYNYCDFRIYIGISSCVKLWVIGKKEAGYYRFSNGGSNVPPFVYCINYYTCEQLQKFNGTNTPGVYTMSPADNPYQVHCTFPSGKAITEVWHSSMEEVKASAECEDGGCYSWTPQYDIRESSILEVIENSLECRQFIKVRCRGMVLFRNNNGGWWESRQGEKMTYWGGATSERNGYCACGETDSCLNNSYKCNCDRNRGDLIAQDQGFLTDKSKLPVRKIRLGDMGDSTEDGWHSLGKLECMG